MAQEKRETAEKWYRRYEETDRATMDRYETEVDSRKNEYLSALQEEKNIEKEIVSLQIQKEENLHQISLLQSEQRDKGKQLLLALSADYHSLRDEIRLWENTYVLKAPFAGK